MEQKQQQFLNLYNPVQKQLSNYCRALTGNEADAHDLLQETVLRAYEKLDDLRNVDSFVFYISAIARNIYHKSRRRLKFWIDIEKSGAELIQANITPADVNFEVQILYKAMSTLPFNQREALVMFEIMGFSLEEIRQHQGGSLSGVKSRVKRARQRLTDILVKVPVASPTVSVINTNLP